jgi:hypothetical protein
VDILLAPSDLLALSDLFASSNLFAPNGNMKASNIFLALPALALALPYPTLSQRQDGLQCVTDTLLFSDSMAQFQAARNAQDPPELDWTSDGCTAASDNPLGSDFLYSRERHVFGYYKYKAQGRFDDSGKAAIDKQFKSDMDSHARPSEARRRPAEAWRVCITRRLYSLGPSRSRIRLAICIHHEWLDRDLDEVKYSPSFQLFSKTESLNEEKDLRTFPQ